MADIYEHTEAGRKAAEEPVTIPGAHPEDDAHATGDDQAAKNRENDPPA